MSSTLVTPIRIAMWSGPRNVSTALLRSFGNRPDTVVHDEPFYAHYLVRTGLPHPGADRIIAHHESDWRKVAETLTGPVPDGKSVYYQKHMAHHLLLGMEGDWIERLSHCFLIRHPREMLPSLDEKFPKPRFEDTGLPQQVALFEAERRRTGRVPPVVDSRDLLLDPQSVLGQLCGRLGIPFFGSMLSWPPGRRSTDGIWAEHWYDSVEKSTGFEPYRAKSGELPDHLAVILPACLEAYDALAAHRIRA
jgi:hypothetical protein